MIETLRSFHLKTRIFFGRGGISFLGNCALDTGAKKFLLVADPGIEKTGYVDRARTILDQKGMQGEIFCEIEPEPYLDSADRAAELGKSIEAGLVIGMGGGSAMDTAKKLEKEGLPEDEVKVLEKEIQDMTNLYIDKVDKHFVIKEKDIMTV